jgi:hypothetical protein
MGHKRRRKFKRLLGVRRYRKMFVLATEGAKTEPLYFNMFNNDNTVIHVKCLKGNRQNSPGQVLKRMNDYLKTNRLKSKDEAWLIVDRDQWLEDQLIQLHEWSQTNSRHGLAVSNPKFEYWLLLHFEDGTGITSSRQCTDRLKRYLPHFEKSHVETDKLRPGIHEATRRARLKDAPPCTDWPRITGTTVYRLVEKLIQTNN